MRASATVPSVSCPTTDATGTYFPNLSAYGYHAGFDSPGTRNVGWLEKGHDFVTGQVDNDMLRALWAVCAISVAETRGLHEYSLCEPHRVIEEEREGLRLLLGSAEIRVFSNEGQIYAAPNLVFHYVCEHRYRPPEEFVQALRTGPKPPSQEYFDALMRRNLTWRETGRSFG